MIIIPARLESSRLPRKALERIGGRYMIDLVASSCTRANCGEVVVAACQRLAGALEWRLGHSIDRILETGDHPTGTDRIHEAVNLLGLDDDEIVINVQGDCPIVHGEDLRKLMDHPEVKNGAIATLIKRKYGKEKRDTNIVKAVTAEDGRALYFSRAAIPHDQGWHGYSEHIGIYAYTAGTLRKFCEGGQGELEYFEEIEHLRALERGIAIYCVETDKEYISVNTEEDLKAARWKIK